MQELFYVQFMILAQGFPNFTYFLTFLQMYLFFFKSAIKYGNITEY